MFFKRAANLVLVSIALGLLNIPAKSGPLSQTAANINGIPVQIIRDRHFKSAGTYFFALNDTTSIYANTPPYCSFLITSSERGKMSVSRKFCSEHSQMALEDFKPLADGKWSYGISRIEPLTPTSKVYTWSTDLRLFDPVSGTDLLTPDWYPNNDVELDGHETVVIAGDLRIFLFYRHRNEGGIKFVDMEVVSIDSRNGKRNGFWTSKGKFPDSMVGDYLHFNSIQFLSDLKVLVSARSTDTLYIIDLASDKIVDRIGRDSWKIESDPYGGFEKQHYAHFSEQGNLLMYDNGDPSTKGRRSRAVEYHVNWTTRTLTMVWQKLAADDLPFRGGWGSVAILSDQSRLISWGDMRSSSESRPCAKDDKRFYPVFSRYGSDGKLKYEIRALCGWATYRAYFQSKQ